MPFNQLFTEMYYLIYSHNAMVTLQQNQDFLKIWTIYKKRKFYAKKNDTRRIYCSVNRKTRG